MQMRLRGLQVRWFMTMTTGIWSLQALFSGAIAQPLTPTPPTTTPAPDQTVDCEILIVGGGLAGTAAAYESLLAGRTTCLTDITDWIGGQITSQGTSALDEIKKQRSTLFYSRGYKEFRKLIQQKYGKLNPGDCWVSASCYIPKDAQALLQKELKAAARKGKAQLKWFPNTVIKDLQLNPDGKQIQGAIAIQRQPVAGTPPINTEPLSQVVVDSYRYEDSPRFTKQVIQFIPTTPKRNGPTNWYVIEATETGELIALADVPYRLGLDPRSFEDPSSASQPGDPYCTQGFTYTFAMEQTETPQPQPQPAFYDQYQPYYGYDPNPNLADFDVVFTYRRIWAPNATKRPTTKRFKVGIPKPGDISMQNWVWGNDYRPGTAQDNLIYTREQLQQRGELSPGGWMGGLRQDTLRKGEEISLGFYHWLVAGTTDSQLGDGVKKPYLNHRLLTGLESPMGTVHGLSKYPYIREGRRIIGRPAYGYADGFTIAEIDFSNANFRDAYYRQALSADDYRQMWIALSGLNAPAVVMGDIQLDAVERRTRSHIYPDSVGISLYAIDFHPCMAKSPPEAPGNTEREGTRQGHGQSYPAQIPLRSMIPQKLDNLLVAGKSIATSHIAAGAYRVHSFEWSVGAAAGTMASFALERGLLPYQLVDNLPRPEPELRLLQRRLMQQGNPTAFPNTSILNLNWKDWLSW
jgi:hypothetical protein